MVRYPLCGDIAFLCQKINDFRKQRKRKSHFVVCEKYGDDHQKGGAGMSTPTKNPSGTERAYVHAQEHAHTHELEPAQEAAHTHGSEHAHGSEHTYGSEHTHGLAHAHEGHTHGHAPAGAQNRDAAVLRYMLDHNTHHAEELLEMARQLAEKGAAGAADQVRMAAGALQEGNAHLRLALEQLPQEG